MRFYGPADMLSAAVSIRDGVNSAIVEFSLLADLINRSAALVKRADAVLDEAERVLARAHAALAEAEATIKGASATVAESAAASLLASKALHDSEGLIRRADQLITELGDQGRRPASGSLGWPEAASTAPAAVDDSDPVVAVVPDPPAPTLTSAPKARPGKRVGKSAAKKTVAKKTAASKTAAVGPRAERPPADDDFGLPKVESAGDDSTGAEPVG